VKNYNLLGSNLHIFKLLKEIKMTSKQKSNRRVFLMSSASVALTFGVASQLQAQSMVVESDPQATALGYKSDASKVDKAKQPKYSAGSACANCALFQGGAGAASGGCPIFAGKQVSSKGWCSAYAKKG
jgi:hypothetical protein